jgi:hypothetical protein
MGTGRRGLRVLLVNLGVLAVGLLIVELAFGQWLRPRNRMARLNLVVDKTLSYDVTPLYRDGDGTAIYKRDRFGFRGPYPHPSRIDILTVGGSTTDQRYITEGKTWQDVLAREFRKAGKSVSVVNAGVDGQSTYGHTKNFDWWFSSVPDLRVRYFVFYVGINDYYIAAEGNPKDSPEPGQRSLRSLLSENSALYYLQRTIQGISSASRSGVGHKPVAFSKMRWTTVPLRSDHLQIMREYLAAYQLRLETLLVRSRRLGGEPICVTQATRYYKVVDGTVFGSDRRGDHEINGVDFHPMRYRDHEINGVDFYHMFGLLNGRTLDVCRQAGALTVDVAGGVEWEDADFYNWTHNTPRGTEKLGRYVYANLSHLF